MMTKYYHYGYLEVLVVVATPLGPGIDVIPEPPAVEVGQLDTFAKSEKIVL
jgi:hypothetical protein